MTLELSKAGYLVAVAAVSIPPSAPVEAPMVPAAGQFERDDGDGPVLD